MFSTHSKYIYITSVLVIGLASIMFVSAFSGPGTVPPPTGTATTSAILPVSQGGTGGSNPAAVASALGAAAAGSNSNITSLNGLTTPLLTTEGGTGTASSGPAGNILTANGSGGWISQTPSFGSNGTITTSGGTPTSSQIVSSTHTVTFTSSGSFVVPQYVGSITITVYGAQGYSYSGSLTGGYGGSAQGTLAVVPGTTYYYSVGGMTWFSANTVFDGNALLVAGQGGGSTQSTIYGASGGCGGGTTGCGGGGSRFGYPGGGAGTQSGGGGGGGSSCYGYGGGGGFGSGGGAICGYGTCSGSGGQGWYGGGGGGLDCSTYPSGGGGGSGHVSASLTNTSMSSGVNAGGGSVVITYVLPDNLGSNVQYGTASIVGNDTDGTITMPNMTVINFTMTFGSAFSRVPSCIASAANGALVTVSSESTTGVTFTFSTSPGNTKVNYVCLD